MYDDVSLVKNEKSDSNKIFGNKTFCLHFWALFI